MLYATTAEISNRISGTKTQLKRHAGGQRDRELRAYLAHLEAAREDFPLEQRLEELDQRWDAIVTDIAAALYGRPGDYKVETARRNAEARKRARRGLPALETVSHEMRRLAEQRLLDSIDRNHETDQTAGRLHAEIAESNQLRAELLERAERRSGLFETAA